MRSPSPSRLARRGVTLLELLVVLLLMALSAVLVLPSLPPLGAASDGDPRATVIASARRAAIRRGETLRLSIDADGTWALVAQHDGDVLDGGRLTDGPVSDGRESGGLVTDGSAGAVAAATRRDNASAGVAAPLVLTITALGSCLPVRADGPPSANALVSATRFDVLDCAWVHDGASRLTRLSRSTR